MDLLSRLALSHDTDKWGLHFYTKAYHKHLAHFRLRTVKLLELGIGGYQNPDEGGGSLRLWKSYLPKGEIVGIDLFAKLNVTEDRITVLQGSQSDTAFLSEVSNQYGPFDIVIDDGSHVRNDVITSFDTLFPLMSQGGVYVIEDTQTSYWSDFGGSVDLDDSNTIMGRMKSLADHLNHAEIQIVKPNQVPKPIALSVSAITFYHNIIFVQKGDNTGLSSVAHGPNSRPLLRAHRILQQLISAGDCPADTYAKQAQISFKLGRLDDALVQQRHAVALESNLPRQHGRLARLLANLERWVEAADSYRAALVLSPTNSVYAAELARCLALAAAETTGNS